MMSALMPFFRDLLSDRRIILQDCHQVVPREIQTKTITMLHSCSHEDDGTAVRVSDGRTSWPASKPSTVTLATFELFSTRTYPIIAM